VVVPIIDTDTHIVEMPDTWTSRLSRRFGDEVLQIRPDNTDNRDYWFLGDRRLRPAWSQCDWGWRREGRSDSDWFVGPNSQDEAHPATYDLGERVALMDDWGIALQVLYPNIAGFNWAPFARHPDPDLSAAHVSAYNDYQLEWVAEAPGRFIPMLVIPHWDLKRSLAEIERLANDGFGGIVMTGAPHQHGEPYLTDRYWDPLWSVCQSAGLSVSFHVASGDISSMVDEKNGLSSLEGPDIFEARGPTQLFLDNAKHVTELLTSGILARFPTLNFVSVESGIGWVPFVLDALDVRFKSNKVYKNHPEFGDMLPSDFFHRQVFVNFWFERLKPFHLETVGLSSILFETDFPHRQGIYYENFGDALELALGEQPEDIWRQILWSNPARLYRNALEFQGVQIELTA
jgi:predicted TIM-barrel fold metal-dependent hydrolase